MYEHMLLTRLVDRRACEASRQGQFGFVASCRGHEAAQVGSAICIEVGQDFTLPYYRDLGVVLTIGMTPYEVFRTYRQTREPETTAVDPELDHRESAQSLSAHTPIAHWGYHKHNLVTAPAPVATQIMHAAGIAFACQLRKATAVTVAYCGDGATAEPDFLEGITFAAQHCLPVIFLCEQDAPDPVHATLSQLALPESLAHVQLDGSDAIQVYEAMQQAIERVHAGQGPTLLEAHVNRDLASSTDPLARCVELCKAAGAWDDLWASALEARLSREIEQALHDVLHQG
jgi:2-oxoisovalerate dehydrogenase E1 component alpha subunit